MLLVVKNLSSKYAMKSASASSVVDNLQHYI